MMKKLLAILLAALLTCLSFAATAEEAASDESHFIPLPEGETDVLPIDLSAGYKPNEASYISETEYADPSITVRTEIYTLGKTHCFVAWVKIADPSQLRTAPAYDFMRTQVADSEKIANRMKAVVAIGGDYYSYWKVRKGGYMIRQGIKYLDAPIEGRDTLLIDSEGNFHIVTNVTRERIDEVANAYTIVNTLNFGPGLVVDGECLNPKYKATYNQSEELHARAAICQMEPGSGEYVLAVCESYWTGSYVGLTIPDFAKFLYEELGVKNAYNLDGGNSAALIFHGEKQNEKGNPNHRQVSDIIYFASAATENK